MKVLFSQPLPFFLAHGGTQTFVESLMRELPALGIEAEPERWWDERQVGDIIHFVGRPSSSLHVRLAHDKGYRTVMTEFLDQPASRSGRALFLQRSLIRTGQKLLPGLTGRLAWDVYRELDAMVYAAPHEWETAKYLFNADPARGFVIPHGLPATTLEDLRKPAQPGDYLVSVATIAPRKKSVLLAKAARLARVPILFLGKPYSEDEFFREFQSLVDGDVVRYEGFVSDAVKSERLKAARGFVLLSEFESGCFAVYEAAATGLPLLLSDLPWATRGYPPSTGIIHIPISSPESVAPRLRSFYEKAHRASEPTFPILSWPQVAQRYADIYRRVLS